MAPQINLPSGLTGTPALRHSPQNALPRMLAPQRFGVNVIIGSRFRHENHEICRQGDRVAIVSGQSKPYNDTGTSANSLRYGFIAGGPRARAFIYSVFTWMVNN